MESTSPHSPLKRLIMTSHATWNKIQTPNLGLHDPASATSFHPVLCTVPRIRDTPATLAVLLFLQHAQLVSASDLYSSSLYLE